MSSDQTHCNRIEKCHLCFSNQGWYDSMPFSLVNTICSPACSWAKSEAVLPGLLTKSAEMREMLIMWHSISGALLNLHNRVPVPASPRETHSSRLTLRPKPASTPHLRPAESYWCSPFALLLNTQCGHRPAIISLPSPANQHWWKHYWGPLFKTICNLS